MGKVVWETLIIFLFINPQLWQRTSGCSSNVMLRNFTLLLFLFLLLFGFLEFVFAQTTTYFSRKLLCREPRVVKIIEMFPPILNIADKTCAISQRHSLYVQSYHPSPCVMCLYHATRDRQCLRRLVAKTLRFFFFHSLAQIMTYCKL